MSTFAGDHVPLMPFSDVAGSVGTLPLAQMESVLPKLKLGVTIGLTVTVKVVVVAHWPAVGAKV